MATGDRRPWRRMWRTVGIQEVHAEVLPAGKAEIVKKLQAEGKIGGDGGRRNQRFSGAGAGGRRDCDGNGNGYRDGIVRGSRS